MQVEGAQRWLEPLARRRGRRGHAAAARARPAAQPRSADRRRGRAVLPLVRPAVTSSGQAAKSPLATLSIGQLLYLLFEPPDVTYADDVANAAAEPAVLRFAARAPRADSVGPAEAAAAETLVYLPPNMTTTAFAVRGPAAVERVVSAPDGSRTLVLAVNATTPTARATWAADIYTVDIGP